jgi:hypothetical protein
MTPSATRWSEGSTWDGDGYYRECFRFSSGDEKIYASLYCVSPAVPRQGVVVLPHWGHDGRFLLEWCHRLAFGVARSGGCGLVVHWPGWQDSEGDPAGVTWDQLTQVALGAVRSGQMRTPQIPWCLAGIRLGATVASLAAVGAGAHKVALVQPELDPGSYFKAVERRARLTWELAQFRGWWWGEEVPRGLKLLSAGLVRESLEALGNRGVVIHYRLPPLGPFPPNVRSVTLRGAWSRPPTGDHRAIRRETLNFLCGRRAWHLPR